jgi:hypothetical protein
VECRSEQLAVSSPFFAYKNPTAANVFHLDALVHCLWGRFI